MLAFFVVVVAGCYGWLLLVAVAGCWWLDVVSCCGLSTECQPNIGKYIGLGLEIIIYI